MNLRHFFIAILFVLFSTITAFAAEPKLTLYVPFDGSIDATVAGGNSKGVFGLKDQQPEFADGISGKGLHTGGSNQQVRFPAKGNISPDQWTISFWVKGDPGAQWNSGDSFQSFWELTGEEGEIMWFYKYTSRATPWLFARPKKGQGDPHWLVAPAAPEQEWHYWAFTWRKGNGAYMYLDGRLVGQSPGHAPDPVSYIFIGQPANPSVQNKAIDEFKIYDTAMDSGAIARRYWQEGKFALHPTLTVAPTQQKINIDGRINPAEWQNTAGFTGMIDTQSWNMNAPQTSVKMTYDDQNLYVAMHSDNTAEAKNDPDNAALHGYVKKDAVKRDGNVQADDSFFVKLMPNLTGKIYSFFTNGINTIYDSMSDSTGTEDASWQSDAQVKSVVGIEGWSMEAAIPLKSLGIDQLKNDVTWNIDFGRVWKLLRQRTDLWAPGERANNKDSTQKASFGTVNFSNQPDAIVDLLQFNIAADGRVSASVNLSNPGNAPHEIHAILKVGESTLQDEKVLLQSGAQQKVTLTGLPKTTDGPTADVSVTSGGKVLFHQSVPFILEHVGHLTLWNYPSLQQVRLGWGVQSGSDPHSLSLNAQIKDASNKIAQQVTVEHLPSLNDSTLVDVKSLPPGEYTIDVQVKNGETIVQQQAISFDKKALPSWLGNKLGISDTPPPPWTAVEVNKSKDTIGIWGRDYDYAGNLLPTQIINQGKPMLAAPMQLVVNTQSSDAAKAKAQWTNTTAMRATSMRNQTIGAVNVKADSYTEFDGMSWMDLTVTPQSKVLLNGLTIDIPLKAEWAELIKPYNDYRLQQTGVLPEKGWKGNASSSPWVGNGDGGFQFFQESTASWIGSKTIEIIPQKDGTVIYRVHLVDVPTTLDKPLQFAFGWITSPVKPAPKSHRDWRLFSSGGIIGDPKSSGPVAQYTQLAAKLNPNHQFYFPWWQGWWWLPGDYKGNPDQSGVTPVPTDPPNAQMNAVRKYYEDKIDSGITFYGAPYGRLTEMGTSNPWFAQFGDEWVPSTSKFTPDETLEPARRISKVSQASQSLRDFYAWGTDKLLNEGDVHALYYDVSRPITDTNLYHGAGTEMPDGSIEPTRNILGTRRMFQRIYTLMKAKHPDGKVFYHMSGEIMLPVDSFCDALIDGENYTGVLDRKDNRGYEKVLSVDQFRTEYSAQNNFGPASVFLPEFNRAKAMLPDDWKTMGYQHADYLMGLIFLHNSNMWWAYMPYDHVAKVYSAMDRTGWNAKWTFIPYWHQKYFSLPQGVYASIYQSPDNGKVLLVLMNTSGKDQDINLPMTLDKSTFNTAKAVYPDQKLNAQNGKTGTIHIPNNDFSSVLLQK